MAAQATQCTPAPGTQVPSIITAHIASQGAKRLPHEASASRNVSPVGILNGKKGGCGAAQTPGLEEARTV